MDERLLHLCGINSRLRPLGFLTHFPDSHYCPPADLALSRRSLPQVPERALDASAGAHAIHAVEVVFDVASCSLPEVLHLCVVYRGLLVYMLLELSLRVNAV